VIERYVNVHQKYPIQKPITASCAIGNGATEYMLPAMLIGVALLVSAIGVQDFLPNYLKGTVGSDTVTKNLVGQTQTSSEGSVAVKPLGFYTQVKLKPDSGRYLAQYKRNIEALGADGATEKLLSTLNRYIDELLALGKISEAQHAELLKLSNHGHQLAGIQGAIEALAIQSAESERPTLQNTIEVNGITRNLRNLAAMSIISNDSTGANASRKIYTPTTEISAQMKTEFGLNPSFEYVGTPVFEFIQQYEKALNTGEMADPTIRATIRALARDIQQLSQHSAIAASEIYHYGADPSRLNESIASRTSHSHSGEICTVGNHQDQGVYCAP
jgi:hypothetical protein